MPATVFTCLNGNTARHVRGLSMPMRTGCLDNVDSVGDQIVRFPLLIRRWPNWMPRRLFWISLSPRRKWMIPCMDADLLPELSGETWVAGGFAVGTCRSSPAGRDHTGGSALSQKGTSVAAGSGGPISGQTIVCPPT